MSKRRPYIGLSESQSAANAEALYRREHGHTEASADSFRVAWDYRNREPRDLREAVHLARKAYADEVPDKLHDSIIGEGGTPRMTARAEGYIFGSGQSDDAGRDPETGQRDAVGYYHAPFRAALGRMENGSERERKRAAIVSHVTIGQQGPKEAAISEGVPSWCAGLVAEDALRVFLRGLSDMKLHVPRPDVGQEAVTAA